MFSNFPSVTFVLHISQRKAGVRVGDVKLVQVWWCSPTVGVCIHLK